MALASLKDISANVDPQIVEVNEQNTNLLQISVARIVRGYLSRVLSNAVLASWDTPDNTPELVREAAAKLVASQLYFNAQSRGTVELSDEHVSQRLYNEAIRILEKIVSGEEVLVDVEVPVVATGDMSTLDFWPVDDTDRSFSKSMEL